jgi:preprotein translocase subunit SecA
MDLLREGIGFRAYAQKDPLIEYKKESYTLFETLIYNINKQVAKKVFTTYLLTREQYETMLKLQQLDLQHAQSSAYQHTAASAVPAEAQQSEKSQKIQPRQVSRKIGRNEPCPCGSGKKYKNCCGKFQNDDIQEG